MMDILCQRRKDKKNIYKPIKSSMVVSRIFAKIINS